MPYRTGWETRRVNRTSNYLIVIVMFTCCLALPGAAPPLAPMDGPDFATPRCPQPFYRGELALFQALFASSYACTEDIAQALRPHASSATITALLKLIDSAEHTLARRNGVRVLGRLAEGQPGEPAHELVRHWRAADIQAVLLKRLHHDRDNYLLQDLIWVYDSFFFPAFASWPALAAISANTELDPLLRIRAITALGRLVTAQHGHLPDHNIAFLEQALRSDNAGVRGQAALIAGRLRDNQLTPATRSRLIAALEAAWLAEAPLQLPPDDPTPAPVIWRDIVESVPTPLTARAQLARALDRYSDTTQHFMELRAAYEALSLPHTLRRPGLLIRSGLPAAELPTLHAIVVQTRAAFLDLLGPTLSTPLPNDPNHTLTLVVFGNQATYREYLRAFIELPPDIDGVYLEAEGTIYTHQRTAAQSQNSLAESIRHELGHYLTGRYLFPGRWHDTGYHNEPKGWADEGLAEVLAGLEFGAASYRLPLRPRQLARICEQAVPPHLETLLSQRSGYDDFGRFDYDTAWAFSYYLLTERRDSARRIYVAYRQGNYRLSNVASIAGATTLTTLEADWHTAIRRWCAQVPRS